MVIGWTSIASGGGSNRPTCVSAGSVLALVVVCGMAAGMGCDRKPDTVSRAIGDARNALVSASGNGGSALSAEGREKTYSKVISSLQAISKDNSRPGSAAAAKMLIAQAQGGQAEIAAAKARGLMSGMVLALSDARAKLELYHSQRALSDALASAPEKNADTLGPELQEIDSKIAQKKQEIAETEKRLGEFQERAKSLGEQAQATRRTADEARGSLTEMSAQQRAAKVTEITAQHREADRVEREQANVLLDAEDAQRRIAAMNRQLVALNDQREVVMDAQARIGEMANLRTTDSQESQSQASKTAAEIETLIDAFKKQFDEELKPTLESAISKYTSATSSSREAQKEFQGSAVSANYSHAIAGLHSGFAETADVAIGVIQRLAESSPELPGSEKFRRLVSSLENEKKAALEQAGEAYANASSGFQSARATGRTADIFKSLGEQLGKNGRRIKGEPEPAPEGEAVPEGEVPAPAAEEPATEAPADAAPAEPAADPQAEPAAEPAPEPSAEPAPAPADETTPPEPAPEPTPEPAPEPK